MLILVIELSTSEIVYNLLISVIYLSILINVDLILKGLAIVLRILQAAENHKPVKPRFVIMLKPGFMVLRIALVCIYARCCRRLTSRVDL